MRSKIRIAFITLSWAVDVLAIVLILSLIPVMVEWHRGTRSVKQSMSMRRAAEPSHSVIEKTPRTP